MALFVDGPVANVDTLTAYDSNVLTVSLNEGIDLNVKLLLAHDTLYSELDRLIRQSCWWTAVRSGIESVAWTRDLRLWQVHETLALIYRDGYYSQLNDRNRARAEQYAVLATQARRSVIEHGLGIISYPLRRPQSPAVNLVPASELGGTFYFAASYCNGAGAESAASIVSAVQVDDGNAADLVVGPLTVLNATGWNLYGGSSPDQMFRQNDQPIVLGGDWCYLPSQAVTSGIGLPEGQSPDQHFLLTRYLQRG